MTTAALIGATLAFATAYGLLRLLLPVAYRINLIDRPRGHKVHGRPTPLVGGISMFIGFSVAALTIDGALSVYGFLFAGALVLVVVGVMDDLHELSPTSRFAAQISVGLMMSIGAGVQLHDLGYLLGPNWMLTLGILTLPVTLFATVGVINAVNMADGLDGLAGSMVMVTTAALMVLAGLEGELAVAAILAVFASVILAFLMLNLRIKGRALVFMGDAGSTFLGFVLAWFLIALSQGEQRLYSPVTALWIFALPLIDTVSIMVRRILFGRSPFQADREHMHHLLLALGLSAKQTLLVMVALASLAACIGLAGELLEIAEHRMFLGFSGVFAGYLWITTRFWRTFGEPVCEQ
jgi:UDP-GlcNAc:undecaprenyl-phosphate/decaprenyl-phosphate GlcNAc-1-phosphate transferase